MIDFNYETDFVLHGAAEISRWIDGAIVEEGFKLGEINYVFCDDNYLYNLNQEFLKHDTLTDIISFDYTIGKIIQGDIFISIERVKDNAIDFNVPFDLELKRVMIHGVLHYCGYKDKTDVESAIMRGKEDYYLERIN